LRRAYAAGGEATIAALPTLRDPVSGVVAVIRFNVRNPRAEAWIANYAAELVTAITEDQRRGVVQALSAGMEARQNPRTVALDIVGRVNRATGKREGGIIGLTAQQEGFARAATAELRSGDPDLLAHYLTRQARDRRFDNAVKRAIRDGGKLPADIALKASTRYRARLLKVRADSIARTEALAALNGGQYEALQQSVDSGSVKPEMIRRTWMSAKDERVRDTHEEMHGQTVGLHEPFVSPSGATLAYPGDPAAPAAERIQCRCWAMPRIDFLANI
jgi:hypothetical protein